MIPTLINPNVKIKFTGRYSLITSPSTAIPERLPIKNIYEILSHIFLYFFIISIIIAIIITTMRRTAMNVSTNIQKAPGMADKTRFPNNGTVRNSSASGEQTGQMP